MAFIDRSNIGNAKIAGMAKDLKLVGLDYNVALTGTAAQQGTKMISLTLGSVLCTLHIA